MLIKTTKNISFALGQIVSGVTFKVRPVEQGYQIMGTAYDGLIVPERSAMVLDMEGNKRGGGREKRHYGVH